MAWMFVFSLLSNCYCAPASFASERSAQPAATMHCEHHSDAAKTGRAEGAEEKQKRADCAPRYNTDQFENVAVKTQPVHALDLPFVLTAKKQFSPQSFLFKSKPFLASSPPIYILVRSLLI